MARAREEKKAGGFIALGVQRRLLCNFVVYRS
jgi:hypothetical protein